MMRRVWSAVLFVFVLAAPARAQQAPRPTTGRLVVTVADQTDAVIPNATVTIVGQEQATAGVKIAPAQTSAQGVVTLEGLAPGRYTLQAEFEGFETTLVRDVRVRAGDNRQNVVLAIKKVEDMVVVGQDASSAASDRRGPTFGTALTREQIDALSDDPEEARRQLQDLAGPGAVIRVDSFEGSPLPPKSQIRMIRISRDQFAAENHSAGGIFIEIVSQPGLGPLRGTFNTRLRDGSMTGRSPLVEKKGPERSQDYNLNLGGSLARGKTSFTLGIGGSTAFDTPTLNVARLSGTRSETLGMRRPRESVNASFSLDHALTLDQTLRIGGNRSSNASRNLGIGDYDELERAYQTEGSNYNFRAQHVGPVGRRFFINNRVQVGFTESESRSTLEAPTIRVLDSFTSGGAQQTGGTRTRRFNAASDLDYVRGRHSVRTGVLLDGAWFATDANSNYLGTYTFESLDAFQANRPRSFTRRLGDPNIDYFNLQGAIYVQDDIRVRQNLSLSPGVRYEMQTHVSDFNNIGPRFGVTWAPGAAGRLSLRASAGIFYDWLGTNTYEQTLRVDGFRQRELNIADPAFAGDGFDAGVIPPVNRYLLGDVKLPRQVRFSGGMERALTRTLRAGTTWTHMRGTSLRRGENLNAPVDRVRPDPGFANVIQVVSDARSSQDTVSVFLSGSLNRAPVPGAPPVPANRQPRWDWRRMSLSGQYTAGWLRNNTDGDFWVAPTGDLDREWGTAPGDIRHRVTFQVSSGFLRSLTTSWNLNVTSGTPYTLQSGTDSNGDLIFNDRPEGVGRNTLRGATQVSLNALFAYNWTFGPPATSNQITGISIVNGIPQAVSVNPVQNGRFRVGLQVNATNLFNRANYVGYSGLMTSQLFGRPRDVANPRRFDISLNFGF